MEEIVSAELCSRFTRRLALWAAVFVGSALSEHAGHGDDAMLKVLCAEVFHSVGRCEAIADTSRDHD